MDQQGIQEIPDFNKQEIPKAVLTAEVQAERNVRRYIKKDGTFNKDFEHFFDKDTGKFDSGGRIIYEPTMTKEQARDFITKLCEDTGRKMTTDPISGRPQAVPGWNLDIRVPGMAQSEQKAATVPEGVLRERLNNQLLMEQRSMVNNLAQQVAYLTAQLEANNDTGAAPSPEQNEADKEVAKADREKVKAAAEKKAAEKKAAAKA